MTDAFDYEKISYGKATYKRVQRLRRKGLRRGIQVPYLEYELHKPEKPRIAFWIVALVSTVLFIGIIIGLGFLYNELIKMSSDFTGIGDVFNVIFDPTLFMVTSGLSAIPALLIVLAFVMLIALFLVPVCVALYFYGFVREAFYMANCSKEEFAQGNIISSLILRLIVTLAVATAIFIVLLIYASAESARLLIGLVYGGLMIALGSLLALIVFEKIKSRKWFENLDGYEKQNYLEHDRALRKVKSRLRFERSVLDDIGRLGK